MKNLKLLLILPTMLLVSLALACDNDSSNNANAQQPAPMSGTDATGTVNAPSAQTCPANVMIEGLKAQDVVVLEIDVTGDMMGEATITNSTEGTSAKCSGMIDGSLPADIMCAVSSSNISGIGVGDNLELSVAFSSQVKGIEFANLSGPTGAECAFATLETLSTN